MSDYYAQTLEACRKMKLRIVIYFTKYVVFYSSFRSELYSKGISTIFLWKGTTLTHDTKWT